MHDLDQPLEPLGGRLERGAGVAEDGVATPGEVAEGDVALGPVGGQERFEIAVLLLALEKSVADEGDPVAVEQLEAGKVLAGRFLARLLIRVRRR